MGPSTNVAVLHTFQIIRIQLHDFANLHAESNEPKNLETMQVIESLLFKNFKNLTVNFKFCTYLEPVTKELKPPKKNSFGSEFATLPSVIIKTGTGT